MLVFTVGILHQHAHLSGRRTMVESWERCRLQFAEILRYTQWRRLPRILNFIAFHWAIQSTAGNVKTGYDMRIIREGFSKAWTIEDIEGMVKLFTRFHNISYIEKAITIWTEADGSSQSLKDLGSSLHNQVVYYPARWRNSHQLHALDALNES